MKFIIITLLILTKTIFANEIHILYALNENEIHYKLLKKHKTISNSLSELKNIAVEKGVSVIEISSVSESQFISSMKNPNVDAILWVGHSQRTTDNELMKNDFLLDVNKLHMPKNIFSATHGQMQEIILATCFTEGLKKYYELPNIPYSIIEFKNGEAIQEANNVLVSTNAGLKELQLWLKNTYIEKQITESDEHEIKINARDLKSSKFGYSILVNDKLIGVLRSNYKEIEGSKIVLPRVSRSFKFRLDKVAKQIKIEVRADDMNRFSKTYQKPVDDIIVTSVLLDGKILIDSPVKIGDDESGLDDEIGLSWYVDRREYADLVTTKGLILNTELP
jgi:hypothetical protein